jgi:hypothetical protein
MAIDKETQKRKGTISALVELLEKNGYSVLGAGFKNDDHTEPIIVSLKKFTGANPLPLY